MGATAYVVVGLGFGDEGKGSICDFLTRKHNSNLTVRFNGGAQCAHNVVTDDGRHHTFSQFGSGTFAGARTHLSRYMLFNPVTLIPEARHLIESGVADPYSRLTVEVGAMLTTPFHIAANRIRELARNGSHHGTCGMGIGETMAYAWACGEGKWGDTTAAFPYAAEVPFACDLKEPARLRKKLALLRERLKAEVEPLYNPASKAMQPEWEMLDDFEGTMAVFQPYVDRVVKNVGIVMPEWLDEELKKDQTIVFEGAQGALLDENHGFHPHTTWSTTTFANAESLVRRVKGVKKTRVGVLRGYMTRHGAGPFVTEDKDVAVPESEHNGRGGWQGEFRMGHFDALMANYALEICGGVDELALTCLDHLGGPIKAAWEYTSRSTGHARFDRMPVHRYEPENGYAGPTPWQHLHKMEELGKTLGYIRPIYSDTPDTKTFLAQVEKATKTPIGILSYGPRASDKRRR